MRSLILAAVAALLIAGQAAAAPKASGVRGLAVSPARVTLDGRGAEQGLIVTGLSDSGAADLTGTASYRSSRPAVATVSGGGIVRIVGNGDATVEVRARGRVARVPVHAGNAALLRPLSFPNDVLPVLSRAGCNQATCHAKQGGKGGFQLSVLAYDPEADYAAITRGSGGRRVNRLEPEMSLVLRKPTLGLPHAGGQRFAVNSPEYRLLARWLAEGARYGREGEPSLTRLEVTPAERVMTPKAGQQLLTTAVYSDGSRRDVTRLADYKSNETSIADVDDRGRVRASTLAGEAAVMVRYMGQVAVARVTVPLPTRVPAAAYQGLPRRNFIDEPIYRKLAQLNVLPSPTCDDATFLRRAYLDLIGTLPTEEETRDFLAGSNAQPAVGSGANPQPAIRSPQSRIHSPTQPDWDTRARLVDRLLERPEYGDYWGMRWVNLLLVDRDPLFPKGAFAYDRWVREAFRTNMPFDRFAHDIVTASGETYHDGAANFFRALATPTEEARSISQLFLGVRIDCAQCHHHPFERWSQDDYYSMAAFFARVKRKGLPEFEQLVMNGTEGEVEHPKTGKTMPPKPLGGPVAEVPDDQDRREYLARWMTAPDNPFFARAIVNRVWGTLMGRGIVEPIDDFRVTNPASNEPLLDALVKDFVAHGYDLKHLLRTITASAAYQRSSASTRNNARDTRNYARFYPKRMVAEVLLDAVGQVTASPEHFDGHPATTRAIQMWDNKLPVEFLETFGRPSRLSVCECDRPADGSVTQVLLLMNSSDVQSRLTSDSGAAAQLAKSGKTPEQIIRELYLTAYNRYPTAGEAKAAGAAFNRPGVSARTATEDLLWVLMNSPEFLFIH